MRRGVSNASHRCRTNQGIDERRKPKPSPPCRENRRETKHNKRVAVRQKRALHYVAVETCGFFRRFRRLHYRKKEFLRFLNAEPLPGDCHASLAMTEYFVRNITRVCLPESICRIFVLSLFYPVQRTLCHSEELRCNDVRISRKGTILQTHARYFCTCVEKKAHTSKRVSVIACDNVISKVQCAPRGKTIPPQLRWYCLLMCLGLRNYGL